MNMRMNARIAAVLAAAPLAMLAAPNQAFAGFAMSGFDAVETGGEVELRIPASGVSDGVSHELNPFNYTTFRVRAKHLDSNGPGWISDEVTPASGNLQFCWASGCEAPPINVGSTNLDWDNGRVRFFLEAKSGPLQPWEQYALPLP